MGTLDSLQGIFVVVGGRSVPGIMQNLLLQGVVPVTMIVSLLLLRYRGCTQCRDVRSKLKSLKMRFQEHSSDPVECSEETCVCSVSLGDRIFKVL